MIEKIENELVIKSKESTKQVKINLNNKNNDLFKKIIATTNKEVEKTNDNTNIAEIKIERKSKINNFTSKEIQEENKEITRNIQNEAYNEMNIDEKEENENVASFLLRIAKISRISYRQSKKLFQMMTEKYIEKEKIDKSSLEKENVFIEFSSWVKNSEKNDGIKEEYQKIITQENLFEKEENQFFTKLFYDLTILYFHCEITFPLVIINFKKIEDFNSSEMIDFINRGKNRKVNFVFLPSLFSNGNFLQNGKSWVFTYTKNTFRFKDLKDESLDELIEKENVIPKKEKKKDNLKMKIIVKIKTMENILQVKII